MPESVTGVVLAGVVFVYVLIGDETLMSIISWYSILLVFSLLIFLFDY